VVQVLSLEKHLQISLEDLVMKVTYNDNSKLVSILGLKKEHQIQKLKVFQNLSLIACSSMLPAMHC